MLETTKLMLQNVCDFMNIQSIIKLEFALYQEFGFRIFDLLDILHVDGGDNPLSCSDLSDYQEPANKIADISLCGKIGSGKTTIQKHICINYDCIRLSFAGSLKQVVSYMFKLPIETMSGEGDRREHREATLRLISHMLNRQVSIRSLLQVIGTQVFRNGIDQQIWIDKLISVVQDAQKKKLNIVIDDARFPNERACLRRLGFQIWFIDRPSDDKVATEVSSHDSENMLDDCYDVVIDNVGSLEDLFSKVDSQITNL